MKTKNYLRPASIKGTNSTKVKFDPLYIKKLVESSKTMNFSNMRASIIYCYLWVAPNHHVNHCSEIQGNSVSNNISKYVVTFRFVNIEYSYAPKQYRFNNSNS